MVVIITGLVDVLGKLVLKNVQQVPISYNPVSNDVLSLVHTVVFSSLPNGGVDKSLMYNEVSCRGRQLHAMRHCTHQGPTNREVKIWTLASEDGWQLPIDSEAWFVPRHWNSRVRSSESQIEESFFKQVVAMPQAGLLLLANAKKNAIYVVH
ncbi:hypothetical protein RHMOL_Rhmol10G0299800 [Rhododendron molle]|uniref:Uncharacterized protein n=1 Tax=Rhododendron molle TaxID=49168 RepID=A0ACC0M882_RHOML|nr:hypothetical protein RHMOL_Rhmol10G0299800 [Rhododendron molle]